MIYSAESIDASGRDGCGRVSHTDDINVCATDGRFIAEEDDDDDDDDEDDDDRLYRSGVRERMGVEKSNFGNGGSAV